MPMHQKGLTKLMEEMGELTQVAAKKSSYLYTDVHPDNNGLLSSRMEEEVGDVLAAIEFVIGKHRLNREVIEQRRQKKLKIFREWDFSDPKQARDQEGQKNIPYNTDPSVVGERVK
ncbi:hypothetical protein K9N68_37370 (plasmid) [Kovacikia minuta CCNUW1]|uniref:hypothetical protein n=1 Tax=Kovacikia minuta TaxID=2931930 RepID=UPI001CCD70FC|nr:hypothetical protein [Kovacikia minuta]UBF29884.1 hypothetical protein K9N68_37370 [Kovacikia minuta CCNUW1]